LSESVTISLKEIDSKLPLLDLWSPDSPSSPDNWKNTAFSLMVTVVYYAFLDYSSMLLSYLRDLGCNLTSKS